MKREDFIDNDLDFEDDDDDFEPGPPTREEYDALERRLMKTEEALEALLNHLYYSDLKEPDSAFDEELKCIIDEYEKE